MVSDSNTQHFTELVWCIATYETLSKSANSFFQHSWLAQLHQARSSEHRKVLEFTTNSVFAPGLLMTAAPPATTDLQDGVVLSGVLSVVALQQAASRGEARARKLRQVQIHKAQLRGGESQIVREGCE